MTAWPDWWQWEIEISAHALKRMADRRFTETDLRAMMQDALGLKPDFEPGRWVVETGHDGVKWEIIIEPDKDDLLLVIITAYEVKTP